MPPPLPGREEAGVRRSGLARTRRPGTPAPRLPPPLGRVSPVGIFYSSSPLVSGSRVDTDGTTRRPGAAAALYDEIAEVGP